MRQEDFFSDPSEHADHKVSLRTDLLQQAIQGTLSNLREIDLADILVQLAHKELLDFSTGGYGRTNDDEDMQLILKACHVACMRAGVTFPRLPFRDLNGFQKYWISQGMSGSYAARREYLARSFQPVEAELAQLSFRSWNDELATAISPHSSTGWSIVDSEIRELRRRFEVARTDQDHCAVGAACVRILEQLGEVAFDPAVHLYEGEIPPPREKTKARFGRVISHALPGSSNEAMRKLANSVVEVAHAVKHSPTPSRCEAGIAADSVILLANLLRRLSL